VGIFFAIITSYAVAVRAGSTKLSRKSPICRTFKGDPVYQPVFLRLEQVLLQLLLRAVLIIVVISVGLLEPSYALTAALDVSTGYSDNVLASSDYKRSGYSQYQIDLDQTLSENSNRSLGFYVTGRYRDYFRFTNQWQATLGVSSWHRLVDGHLHGYNFIEISALRDDFIPLDDCNRVDVGSQWRWFFDDQWSASLQVNYQLTRYRDKTVERELLFLDGSGPGKKNKGKDVGSGMAEIEQRDDELWQLMLGGEYLLSADLSSELLLLVSRNHSTISSESYEEIGVENRWRYYLLPDVSAEVAVSHLWRDYDTLSERDLSLKSELIWQYSDAVDLYLRCQKRWNDSPIKNENYSELVSECGLIWSF